MCVCVGRGRGGAAPALLTWPFLRSAPERQKTDGHYEGGPGSASLPARPPPRTDGHRAPRLAPHPRRPARGDSPPSPHRRAKRERGALPAGGGCKGRGPALTMAPAGCPPTASRKEKGRDPEAEAARGRGRGGKGAKLSLLHGGESPLPGMDGDPASRSAAGDGPNYKLPAAKFCVAQWFLLVLRKTAFSLRMI